MADVFGSCNDDCDFESEGMVGKRTGAATDEERSGRPKKGIRVAKSQTSLPPPPELLACGQDFH